MTNKSKKKSVFYNATTALILQGIGMVFGLIVPRLILTRYGSTINGLTSTITQLLTYLNLIESGLGMSLIISLYKPLANNEWNEVNSIVSAGKIFYKKVGNTFSVSLICLSLIFSVLVKNQVGWYEACILFMIMGTGTVIEYFIQGKYRILLAADQKLYVVNIIQIISIILSNFIKIILIINGNNIIFVMLASSGVYLLKAILYWLYVKIKYKYINYNEVPNFNSITRRKAIMYHQIAGLVVNNTDTIILTIFTNLKVVSVYSVYNFVFSNLFLMITNIFSQSIIPIFGNAFVSKDESIIRKYYNCYEAIYFATITCIYSITVVMIIPFISLYTKGVNDIDYINYTVALLFIIISLANNFRVPGSTMINSKGTFKETQKSAIIEAVINIVVSFSLVIKLGIYGVLIGTVASFMYRTRDIIIFSNKNIIKQSSTKTILRCIICILTIMVNLFIINSFISYSVSNWIDWIMLSIISTVISSVITIIVNMILEKENIIFLYRILKRK